MSEHIDSPNGAIEVIEWDTLPELPRIQSGDTELVNSGPTGRPHRVTPEGEPGFEDLFLNLATNYREGTPISIRSSRIQVKLTRICWYFASASGAITSERGNGQTTDNQDWAYPNARQYAIVLIHNGRYYGFGDGPVKVFSGLDRNKPVYFNVNDGRRTHGDNWGSFSVLVNHNPR